MSAAWHHHPLFADPWFRAGAGLATLWLALWWLGPWLSQHDPHAMIYPPLSFPSSTHWLGVNDGGMDLFAELVASLGNTVTFGLLTGSLALVLGVGIGLSSAWWRGYTDRILMRIADLILAIPAILILILLAAFLRPDPLWLAVVLAAMAWPSSARLIRAQALTLRHKPYILAAQQMGASAGYILRRHWLPALYPLYFIALTAHIRMAIFMEASLSFLGLFDPTRKSLGRMISDALPFYFLGHGWHWLLPPIALLVLVLLSLTFLAVSLEQHFDPRLRDASWAR